MKCHSPPSTAVKTSTFKEVFGLSLSPMLLKHNEHRVKVITVYSPVRFSICKSTHLRIIYSRLNQKLFDWRNALLGSSQFSNPTSMCISCWIFTTLCISEWFFPWGWGCNTRYLQTGCMSCILIWYTIELQERLTWHFQSRLTNVRSCDFAVGTLDQKLPVCVFLITSSQSVHTLQVWAVVHILCVGKPAQRNLHSLGFLFWDE